jgi:3-dehydroquinate synthetase
MEANAGALKSRDVPALTQLVRWSVVIKGQVVAQDERESGRRSILNAGHTVAHALELVSDYQLPHGEAVALGLIVECQLSEQLGLAAAGLRQRVATLLASLGLPARLGSAVEPAALLSGMARDKKNRDGQIHLALPSRVGEMHRASGWTTRVPVESILSAISVIK